MKPLYHEDTIANYVWIIAVGGGFALWWLDTRWSYGFLLGTLMAGLGFRLLIADMRRLTAQTHSPTRLALAGYLKRYLLYGFAMAAGLTNPLLAFAPLVIGLLVPKFLILFFVLVARRTSHGS